MGGHLKTLLILGAALALPGCGNSGGKTGSSGLSQDEIAVRKAALEARMTALDEDRREVEARAAQREAANLAMLDAAREEASRLASGHVNAAGDAISSEEAAAEKARQEARQAEMEKRRETAKAERAKFKGMELGELKTASGNTFLGVVVKEADDLGINCSHQNGFARVQYPDLPAELQERFLFNQEDYDYAIALQEQAAEVAAAGAATEDEKKGTPKRLSSAEKRAKDDALEVKFDAIEAIFSKINLYRDANKELETTIQEIMAGKGGGLQKSMADRQKIASPYIAKRKTNLAQISSLKRQADPLVKELEGITTDLYPSQRRKIMTYRSEISSSD